MRGRLPPCSRIIVDHPPSDAGDEPPGGEEPARVERRLDAAHERDALSWIAPHVDLRLHLRRRALDHERDRKSTRLNSSHLVISYAVFCLKKKTNSTMIMLTVSACVLL